MPESSSPGCGLRVARPPPPPRQPPRCPAVAAALAVHVRIRSPASLPRPFINRPSPHRSPDHVSSSRVSDGVLQQSHLSDAPLDPVLNVEVVHTMENSQVATPLAIEEGFSSGSP